MPDVERHWKVLNKRGQPSFDPWPEIPMEVNFSDYRHLLVADEIALRASLDDEIVDFGCGDGRTLGLLASYGFRDLTGIDHSHEGLRRTALRSPVIKTDYVDLLKLHAKPCDVAICTEVLEHLPTDPDVFAAVDLLFRSVRSDGLVVVSVPDDSICEVDSDHRRLFSQTDHVHLLERAGFTRVRDLSYLYSEKYPKPWLTAVGVKP